MLELSSSVIKLALPDGSHISIAQDATEEYQVSIRGVRKYGTVELWDGKEVFEFLDGVALANYILQRTNK